MPGSYWVEQPTIDCPGVPAAAALTAATAEALAAAAVEAAQPLETVVSKVATFKFTPPPPVEA
eukprot:11188167-Lingulodinium_polyedra.AAC.1